MTVQHEILTDEDLHKLTHSEVPGVQARVLRENGIYFIKGVGGKITTTWTHVNNPLFLVKPNNDAEPDWSGMTQ